MRDVRKRARLAVASAAGQLASVPGLVARAANLQVTVSRDFLRAATRSSSKKPVFAISPERARTRHALIL